MPDSISLPVLFKPRVARWLKSTALVNLSDNLLATGTYDELNNSVIISKVDVKQQTVTNSVINTFNVRAPVTDLQFEMVMSTPVVVATLESVPEVMIFNVKDDPTEKVLKLGKSFGTSVALDTRRGEMAIGTASGSVLITDFDTLSLRRELRLPFESPINKVVFLSSNTIAAASYNVSICDTRANGVPTIFTHGDNIVTSLAVLPEQIHFMMIGRSNGAVELWDQRFASAPLSVANHHVAAVWDMVFYRGRDFVMHCVTGGEDGAIFTWNLGSNPETPSLGMSVYELHSPEPYYSCAVNSVDVHADQGFVIAARDNSTLLFYRSP